MRPAPEMIPVLIDTAKTLKGSQRRAFMAKTVHAMGRGPSRLEPGDDPQGDA